MDTGQILTPFHTFPKISSKMGYSDWKPPPRHPGNSAVKRSLDLSMVTFHATVLGCFKFQRDNKYTGLDVQHVPSYYNIILGLRYVVEINTQVVCRPCDTSGRCDIFMLYNNVLQLRVSPGCLGFESLSPPRCVGTYSCEC